MSAQPLDDQRLHLVLLVGNPIEHDTRVRKTALSAVALGLRVTVVAYTHDLVGSTTTFGPVDVVNVPVEFTLRDRSADRRRLRRFLLFPFGYGSPLAIRAAARRRRLADLDLMVDSGRGVQLGHYDHASVGGTMARLRRNVRKQTNRVHRKFTVVRIRIGRLYTGRRLPLDRARAQRWFSHRPMGNWRRLLPEYLDYEVSFAPVIDELAPDLLHANDVVMIGVASNAVDRARLRGRTIPWLYDAHEYVPGMGRYLPDRIAGMADHEKEYIGRADAVLTVSDPIADSIQQRTGLTERPIVVLNTPYGVRAPDRERPSVRAAVGLAEGVPLLVYSGNMAPDRGVTTLVEALEFLDPAVHVALVTNVPLENRYMQTLVRSAEGSGCRDRLHFAPYVPGGQIADYLSTGDVGVQGLNHVPNHEMALPNKLFDYLHAGLPMIVSDVKAMADFVTGLGIGEVYVADDPVGLAKAAMQVLSDPERYAKAQAADPELLRTYSWERQEERLREVYARLLGCSPTDFRRPSAAPGQEI